MIPTAHRQHPTHHRSLLRALRYGLADRRLQGNFSMCLETVAAVLAQQFRRSRRDVQPHLRHLCWQPPRLCLASRSTPLDARSRRVTHCTASHHSRNQLGRYLRYEQSAPAASSTPSVWTAAYSKFPSRRSLACPSFSAGSFSATERIVQTSGSGASLNVASAVIQNVPISSSQA